MLGTAMVIDDDTTITEIFSEMLAILGFDVVAIGHSGKDAIKLFRKFVPDTVFMDVHMPEMSGEDALRSIKKEFPKSRIIMVTGDMSQDLEARLEKYGASAIIFKPFNIEKITEVIKQIKSSSAMITQSQRN